MTLFRVYGRKFFDYYIDVEAENEYKAIEIAEARNEEDWSSVLNEDTIEAVEVDNLEELYNGQ